MSNNQNITILHMAFLLIILALLSPCLAFADKASRLNKQGIEQYKAGDAQQSVQSFTDALVERPDSPELRFNRGTALSSAGNSNEAVLELERSATEFTVPADQAASHFNAGNTLAKSGNLDAAIEQYRQAITLDQKALDYRKNLEFALRQKKQQQQQDQQKQQDNDTKQDQQKQKNQDQQQDKKNQEKKQSQNEQQEQNKQQNQQQQNSRPMSPEQAQQILDAMKDEETKAFELKRMMMQEALKPGDDW